MIDSVIQKYRGCTITLNVEYMDELWHGSYHTKMIDGTVTQGATQNRENNNQLIEELLYSAKRSIDIHMSELGWKLYNDIDYFVDAVPAAAKWISVWYIQEPLENGKKYRQESPILHDTKEEALEFARKEATKFIDSPFLHMKLKKEKVID